MVPAGERAENTPASDSASQPIHLKVLELKPRSAQNEGSIRCVDNSKLDGFTMNLGDEEGEWIRAGDDVSQQPPIESGGVNQRTKSFNRNFSQRNQETRLECIYRKRLVIP